MTLVQLATVILAAVNFFLALALGAVYWRNHREMRSPFTLGLLLFAVFLLVHNAVEVWHYFTMMSPTAATGDQIRMAEAALQTAAVGTLVVATFR